MSLSLTVDSGSGGWRRDVQLTQTEEDVEEILRTLTRKDGDVNFR